MSSTGRTLPDVLRTPRDPSVPLLRAPRESVSRAKYPRTRSPIVQAIFAEMIVQGVTDTIMAKRAGVDKTRMHKYRSGKTYPLLLTLEKFAGVLGYELVLRRK